MTFEYRTQVASDIIRDGLGLELIDEHGNVLAEVFRCDAAHTLGLEIFAGSISPDWLVRLIDDAYQLLAHFEDGAALPPRRALSRIYRDFSSSLTYALDVSAERYVELRDRLIASFNLKPVGEAVSGLDQIFHDFESDGGPISIGWDPWMGFTVRAGSSLSEDLVRQVAALVTTDESHLTRP